jgi:Asp-tRNA(Asn)/Glu-tRNA(Gln) amidotransferase A subunit family amidase
MLTDLSAEVHSGRRSARSLVERALERIGRLDGDLNAVVGLRAEAALNEATALDGGSPRAAAGTHRSTCRSRGCRFS